MSDPGNVQPRHAKNQPAEVPDFVPKNIDGYVVQQAPLAAAAQDIDSTPTTGTTFFAPSATALAALGDD